MNEDIIEALENAASSSGKSFDPVTPSRNDIKIYKRMVMRFLEELDAELTIGEVRSALEEYT